MTTMKNDYQQILEIHPTPCVVHIDFKPLYANDAFARFSGLESADQILDMDSLMVLINPEEREDALIRYQKAFDEQKTEPKVIAHTDLAGNPVMVEITDRLINWQGKQALCTFISIVTDTINKQRRLKKLAEQDPLTLLPNRRYIINNLTRLHNEDKAKDYFLAILDIDFFKKVNDTYGHLAGDKTLQQFAELLKSFVAKTDYVGRLGGEEFVILIHSQVAKEVLIRLESLRSIIESHHFMISATDASDPSESLQRIRCTLSIGLTRIHRDENIDASYGRADEALYLAKQQGRNQVIFK